MSVAAPVARNAPCPCGSGQRFKACHGAVAGATPVIDAYAAAHEALRAAGAARPLEAVGVLLAAVKSLDQLPAAPVTVQVWTALNAAFVDALSGRDAAAVSAQRDAYRHWCARREPGPGGQPVAVVLIVAADANANDVLPTLQSIAAQTRPPAELVVVPLGPAPAVAVLRAHTDLMPFDVRFVQRLPAGKAAAIEAGIAHSRAPWILAIEAPNMLAPDHLQALFGGLESGGAQWGFTDCELASHAPATPSEHAAARVALDAIQTALARADSVGHAFIDQAFAPMGSGAVGFARALHARLGGFRALPQHEAWDFALRATLEDEPVHVHAATYLHVVAAAAPQPRSERESMQLAMFRSFYDRALADSLPGSNPYAPSLAAWGLAFARRVFQTGHVLMPGLAALARLHDRIAASGEEALPKLTPGINLLGFAFGEFGLGEGLRGLARACNAGGIPFVVNDLEMRMNTRQADRRLAAHLCADVRHDVSIMCVNPDLLARAQPLLARTREAGGHCVGYWFWELETLPSFWMDAFDSVDEVWCATEFIAAALRRATRKPVVKIPPALHVTLQKSYLRQAFNLPEGRFLFVFTFDYNSFVARKNPGAVIRAFRKAFPPERSDVGLVVKSVNGVHRPDRVASIEALIGGDPRIAHLDAFLDRDASYGLLSVCDAYVSLHRAEGLGLGLAEAMALGKPSIATGYSGNLEFMDETNSLLVSSRPVAIAPGEYTIDDPRFFWAEPDVADAARQMARLVDDRALRERLAAGGPAAIEARFGSTRSAALMRARLSELGVDLR